jgi:RNA polymerase sigma factor (sigma-70 family)
VGYEPPEGFERLFREHYSSVVLKLMQLVRDMSVAEDLAQEVFLRLYRKPPDNLQSLAPWLHRVLTRVAYDYLRDTVRQRRLLARAEQEMADDGTEPGSDCILDRRYSRAQVARALGRLSDRDRQALLLRHSGYSYREIAEVLGVRPEIVGSLLKRATERFRREYKHEEDEQDGRRGTDRCGPSVGTVSTASEG